MRFFRYWRDLRLMECVSGASCAVVVCLAIALAVLERMNVSGIAALEWMLIFVLIGACVSCVVSTCRVMVLRKAIDDIRS